MKEDCVAKTHMILENMHRQPANKKRPNEMPPALLRFDMEPMSVDARLMTHPKNVADKVATEYTLMC